MAKKTKSTRKPKARAKPEAQPRKPKVQPAAAESKSGKQLPLPLHAHNPSPAQQVMNVFVDLFQGLGRHLEDILGIILILVAGYGLLGLSGQSEGAAIEWLTGTLVSGLGWGAIFAPLGAGALGVVLIVRRFKPDLKPPWGRVIAGELGLICALAWIQLWEAGEAARVAGITPAEALVDVNGDLLARALAGEGGGIVGWSISLILAERLPNVAAELLLLGALAGLVIASGIHLRHVVRVLHRLQIWLGANEVSQPATQPPGQPATTARAPIRSPRPRILPERKRPKIKVPKRFTVEPQADDRPSKSPKRDTHLPPLDLLTNIDTLKPSATNINRNAALIEQTLADFGLPATVIDFKSGPAVTQFAVEPGYIEHTLSNGEVKRQKVRVSQISALSSDLALALQASPIRIEAPVPGTSYVGIEVPNRQLALVSLRGVIESQAFQEVNRPLAVGLGRDVSGKPIVADLSRMPHLLIAGTTGSGKSVSIISLITCLILNNTPDELRLVMIDPKKVELNRFNGLPHLLGRVETELERIIGTLRWVMHEMEKRYRLLEAVGARDLETYNRKLGRRRQHDRLPYVCVLIDELADLMMMVPDETEKILVRLAQMARATGIHLVVATQRPSVNILTGLIKANFPARVSFAVASSIDSRVILDEGGAEMLLGRGDMLYLAADASTSKRLQGVFVNDRELEAVVAFWKEQAARQEQEQTELRAEFKERTKARVAKIAVQEPEAAPWDKMLARRAVVADKDSDIERAIEVVRKHGTASASLLQRKLRLGYPRAARLMDELQEMGIVGSAKAGGKTREVLIGKDDDPIGDATLIIGGDEE